MAVRLSKASVLPANQELTILLLGDGEVGKTSIVQAYVGRHFPAQNELQPVFNPVNLLPENEHALQNGREPIVNNRLIVDTDGVQLGSNQDAIKAAIQKYKPDVIILVYSLDTPVSLARCASHWMPAIATAGCNRPGWPYIPICLCGSKEDAFDVDDQAGWRSALHQVKGTLQAASLLRETAEMALEDAEFGEAGDNYSDASHLRHTIIEAVTLAYPQIVAAPTISLLEVDPEAGGVEGVVLDLLDSSTRLVTEPLFPIFDAKESVFTAQARQAIARIFRMIDRDCDGLVSIDEYATYLIITLGIRFTEGEIAEIFGVCAVSCPDGVEFISRAGTSSSSGGMSISGTDENDPRNLALNQFGFQQLLLEQVFSFHLSEIWRTLQTFGYRCGTPASGTEGGPGRGAVDDAMVASLRAAQQKNSTAAGSNVAEHKDRELILYMPDSFASAKADYPDGYLQLSGTESVGNYATASLDSLCRQPLQQTGIGFVAALFKRCCQASGKAVLSKQDVQLIFSVTPSGVHPFGPLYPACSTHNNRGEIGLQAWIHLWQTLCATSPCKALTALYQLGFVALSTAGSDIEFDHDPRRAVEQGMRRKVSEGLPCPVRCVFVVGSKGSGKTSVVMHYLNGPNALREHMQSVAVASLPSSAESGATSSSGKLSPAPTEHITHYASGVVASPSLLASASASSLPITLAITEWPADKLHDAMEAAEHNADVMVLVVDPTTPSSIEYFRRAADLVPDRVPTTVVETQHADRKAKYESGHNVLTALCSEAERVDLSSVTSDSGALGNAVDLPMVTCGLSLERTLFSPKSKHEVTEDLFEFIAGIAPRPSTDNPKTKSRRSREWRKRMLRRVIIISGGAVVIAGVGGAAAYASDYKGCRDVVNTRVRSVWEGTGAPIVNAFRSLLGGGASGRPAAARTPGALSAVAKR